MIAIFDEDGGGDVDFQEFVSGLSAFSSKGNKEEKLRFAFKVYDVDRDGFISNGELFIVLKMMVGTNLKDVQLQQIVDKTIMEADKDGDGKISFEEFTEMVENTDVSLSMTLSMFFCPSLVLLGINWIRLTILQTIFKHDILAICCLFFLLLFYCPYLTIMICDDTYTLSLPPYPCSLAQQIKHVYSAIMKKKSRIVAVWSVGTLCMGLDMARQVS